METSSEVSGMFSQNRLTSETSSIETRDIEKREDSRLSGDNMAVLKAQASRESFHPVSCFNTTWNVPTRYQHLTPCWSRLQGVVCSAVDQLTGQRVRVEKLVCPFHSVEVARATYRRVKLLSRIDHENLLSLVDCFSQDLSERGFSELYLVTKSHEMACDLGTVIRSQSLNDGHVCVLTYQILRALKYLHSGGVVHGDVKPFDMLVHEDCELVLTDLGVEAYGGGNQIKSGSSEGSTTDVLRLLDNVRFGQAADVWSVGCIMAEMITSRALFPGKDHVDQLERIRQTLGFAGDGQRGDNKTYEANTPRWEARQFAEIFAGASAKAIDLLERLLAVDREKRISVEEALRHPYFEQYHDPDDEPTCAELLDDSVMISNASDSADFWRERTRQMVVEWRKSRLVAKDNRHTSLKVTMTI